MESTHFSFFFKAENLKYTKKKREYGNRKYENSWIHFIFFKQFLLEKRLTEKRSKVATDSLEEGWRMLRLLICVASWQRDHILPFSIIIFKYSSSSSLSFSIIYWEETRASNVNIILGGIMVQFDKDNQEIIGHLMKAEHSNPLK